MKADRGHDPRKLEPHFLYWMNELTERGLHSKGDIACEMAALSARIEALEGDLAHANEFKRICMAATTATGEKNPEALVSQVVALEAENARLRAAIKPLVDACEAEMGGAGTETFADDEAVSKYADGRDGLITFGMIRAAVHALAPPKENT